MLRWRSSINAVPQKLHVYADETGQDTAGRLFIVGIVLVRDTELDRLEERFLKFEGRSRHLCKKWHRTRPEQKGVFAAEFPVLSALGATFAWSEWTSETKYMFQTGETVARAAQTCAAGAQITLTVDGLKEAERHVIAAILRRHRVRCRRIRLNCRDESHPLLRLADAVAGFLRDVCEGAPYAVESWRETQSLFVKV